VSFKTVRESISIVVESVVSFVIKFWQTIIFPQTVRFTVWVKKSPPLKFSDIFPKRLGILISPNLTRLLNVPVYAGLQIFIQLSATLTKLYHIKRDHHNVLKISTIDRNARWVVALNMA